MVYPGFIGPAYRSQSISAAGDLLINLYMEAQEVKGTPVFYGTPGTQIFATLPTLPVRGQCSLNGKYFAVGGTMLYRIELTGSGVPIITRCAPVAQLTLPPGTNPISMQTDGKTVVMAVSGQLWVYVIATDTFVSPPVPGAGMVSYADGYYVVNVPDTNEFLISGLFDGTSWSGLDFGNKEGFPDLIIGQLLDHRELWLFGSRTAEVWWNSGNPNFPWERIQGPFPETGLGAPMSLVKADNTHLWLHEDERGARMIWRANGYTPQRVSTFALEYALGTYGRVDDAIAYSYQENGHQFYVISFPSAYAQGVSELVWNQPGLVWSGGGVWGQGTVQPTNYTGATWVLDLSNNMWHQRDYLDPQFGFSQQVRGWNHAYAFGRHLVGDYQNGNIYDQSVNYFTDAYNATPGLTTPIRRLRRAPDILQEHKRIFYPGFELHIQQGVVPQSGPGSAPVFNLRKSSDGGFTWSNYMQRAAGLSGQYRNRLLWHKLGNARDAVFEVTSDEPIQHAWINAYLFPNPEASDR